MNNKDKIRLGMAQLQGKCKELMKVSKMFKFSLCIRRLILLMAPCRWSKLSEGFGVAPGVAGVNHSSMRPTVIYLVMAETNLI